MRSSDGSLRQRSVTIGAEPVAELPAERLPGRRVLEVHRSELAPAGLLRVVKLRFTEGALRSDTGACESRGLRLRAHPTFVFSRLPAHVCVDCRRTPPRERKHRSGMRPGTNNSLAFSDSATRRLSGCPRAQARVPIGSGAHVGPRGTRKSGPSARWIHAGYCRATRERPHAADVHRHRRQRVHRRFDHVFGLESSFIHPTDATLTVSRTSRDV
jgi:hypothetical protein